MDADDDASLPQKFWYQPDFPMYGLAWSARRGRKPYVAVSSFLRQKQNVVQVLEFDEEAETQRGALVPVGDCEHNCVASKIGFRPGTKMGENDLLVSSGRALNVMVVKGDDSSGPRVERKVSLVNVRPPTDSSSIAPLTSYDWNPQNRSKLGTSSVDTTCTIWDLQAERVETQLIAHDKAVHDIAFSQRPHLFGSVGADGSVRLFDVRNLEHSQIMYESSPSSPLLRLMWNQTHPHFITTFALDRPGFVVLDIRRPSLVYQKFEDPAGSCVNSVSWMPRSKSHMMSGGENGKCQIWPLRDEVSSKVTRPTMEYDAGSEILQTIWPQERTDLVCLGMSNRVEIVSM